MTKILFLDIETDSLDTNKAKIKFVGCKEENGTFHIFNSKELNKLKTFLKSYDKIITYNGENYDLPILKNHGIDIKFWNHIDIYQVFKKRAVLIKSGGFKSYKLKNIIKEIKINVNPKGDIDYKIFQKDIWSESELKEIEIYLEQDLNITRSLWEYLLEKFDNLKHFLSYKDIQNFKHITSSSGAYGYKVISKALGIKEEYIDTEERPPYIGGYVMQPTKEFANNVLYLDFASLYPMLYVHANLFSSSCKCCSQEEKWHGNDKFKINGYYCKYKQGKIEEIIKKFYLQRKEFKKIKDSREFAIKITLNSLYGISAKPSFKHLYSKYTASDCTSLARQSINYAITKLKENGFNPIYADTDSCFVELGDKTKEECLSLSEQISKEISNSFPFPWEEFNFKHEDDIDYICFFKDKQDNMKKKNYIYINKENKMTIKGLDIIKKNCSRLGEYIFHKYLKEQIITNKSCLFEKEYIDKIIKDCVNSDKLMLSKTFNIKEESEYKSNTSIYYMIREKYGFGEIQLIKNYKLGAGKSIKYCSLEEAKYLEFEDLNLEDTYKELSVFVKDYNELKKKEKKLSKKMPMVDKNIRKDFQILLML